ncbi:MAG: transposase [Ileibacterium sp.]|nr:transposase [Ileibacterium sp.]
MSVRLHATRSKNSVCFYAIEDFINPTSKKRSTRTVESLGTLNELMASLHADSEEQVRELLKARLKEKYPSPAKKQPVVISFDPNKTIEKDQVNSFNVGYFFIKRILYCLGIDEICSRISAEHRFDFDLENIVNMLVYTRILYPCSKRKSMEEAKNLFLFEQSFQLQDVYRALSVLAQNTYSIEAALYKNSNKLCKRDTRVLYYDCTNFYFETEEEDIVEGEELTDEADIKTVSLDFGKREYGKSKEHRPNPIIQYGLFMSGDGIPLADYQFSGSSNEQPSLKKLEKKIESDFQDCDQFIVCTDSGLNSFANKLFNDKPGRSFISTQSIKKLNKKQKDWVFSDKGWKVYAGDTLLKFETLDVTNLPETLELTVKSTSGKVMKFHIDTEKAVFFKDCWYKKTGKNPETGKKAVIDEHLIITYSQKYKRYKQHLRERKLERLEKMLKNPSKNFRKSTDERNPRFFVKETSITENGEVAEKTIYEIDEEKIAEEKKYDGYYGTATNLNDNDIRTVLEINSDRWEIEESFEIMKYELKSRPMYVSRSDSIRAHLLICFMALLIIRLLEKSVGESWTTGDVIKTLRKMDVTSLKGNGFIPAFKRTDLTDALFEVFGFRADYEIMTRTDLKKISTEQKKGKYYAFL